MAASMTGSMGGDPRLADEWFFSSVKLYDQLHMFNLQNPLTAMCWIGEDRVCVAGKTRKGGELLQLSLPSKLLATDEGLVKDRDFDVLAGGFHDRTIHSMAHVTDRLIAASEYGSNVIRTWTLGNETSGSIKLAQTFNHSNRTNQPALLDTDCMENQSSRVVFGCSFSSLSIIDLESGHVVGNIQDPTDDTICEVRFTDPNTIVACSQSDGKLLKCDLREGKPKVIGLPKQDVKAARRWTCAVECSKNGASRDILVRMSDCGQVFVSDLEEPETWTKRGDLEAFKSDGQLQVRVCPYNVNMISTADETGNVLLYNTAEWSKFPQDGTTAVKFRHEGHWVNSELEASVEVVAHLWHPTVAGLLLSAASDGSLQAWKQAGFPSGRT